MSAIIYIFLSAIIGPIFIAVPYLFNRTLLKNRDRELPQKYESYESGIKPSAYDFYKSGNIITISYYVLAMFFVVLDIDILFTFPLMTVFHHFSSAAFITIAVFTVPIFFAIAYMYKNELFDDL